MITGILVIQLVVLAVLIYLVISPRVINHPSSGNLINDGSCPDDREIQSWLAMADKQLKDGQPDVLEAAFVRFPSSKLVLEKLAAFYLPIVSSGDDLQIRRAALSRFSNYADLFARNCSKDNFSYATETQKKIEQFTSGLIMLAETRQKENIERIIKALEDKFTEYLKNEKDEKLINVIAEIDQAINKEALKAYPALFERYTEISKKFIASFQKGSTHEGKDLDYNLKALKAAKEAWALIQEHETAGIITDDSHDYNKESNMKRLVEKIGGWDSNKLMLPTNTYVSSVYGEIFGKLKPETRLLFTEAMIKEKKK